LCLITASCAPPTPPAAPGGAPANHSVPDAGPAKAAPDSGAVAQAGGDAAMTKSDDKTPMPAEDDSPPLRVSLGPSPATCGLTIGDVALYQSVKVLLVKDGVEVKHRATDVVESRQALLRVFVQASSAWTAADVSASLTITSGSEHLTLLDHRTIAGSSNDADLDSTLRFDVPAEQLTAGASYAVTLSAPTTCSEVRFPANGNAPLRARKVGSLKVKLVPLRFGADGSDRLPDTSPEQLALYRARLHAMYPVASIDLTVREPVRTSIHVTGEPAGWNDLLDAMRDLRAQDHPDDDVFYFGLIEPADTIAAYCPGACYLGLSFRPDDKAPRYQAGVGLGYTGEGSANTLTHELGHMAGRKHAPCKVSSFIDDKYPNADGKTGSWGWDERTRTLYAPDTTRDLMGYCNPAWISDYTFEALVDRLAKINSGNTKTSSLEESRAMRVMLLDQGRARWGLSTEVSGEPAGTAESAAILDANGAVIDHVQVWRAGLGEDGASLLVPSPQPGWSSIQLAGAGPLRFDEPSSVPSLER
jgi:hypothetical protein